MPNNPGQIIGQKRVIAKGNPVITASSAYSSGQAIGAPFALANCVVPGAQGGNIGAAKLIDIDKQSVEIEAWIFSAVPTSPATDKTTFAPSNADLDNLLIGIIDLAAADYALGNANSVCFEGNLDIDFSTLADANTSLYVQLVSRGAPTWTTTSSLRFHLHLTQD